MSGHIDIVFVILNYRIYKETINCISSIVKNLDTQNYHIVVVDNYSENKSGERLREKYKNNSKVSIFISESNCGFARGNNIGIEYAQKYEPKYIYCINNDTLIDQKDFFANLEDIYNRTEAAVIFPLVFGRQYQIYTPYAGLKTMSDYYRIIDNVKEELDKLVAKKIRM